MSEFSRSRIAQAVLLAIGLGGCAPSLAPSAFEGGTPEMRPERFFAGATSSAGVLENASGAPTSRFHVEGSGEQLADGSFRLVQTITMDGEKPTTRTWLLRRIDMHRYSGTLTDASGPVDGEAYGNLFHLRYPMRAPVGGEIEQWLYLQADGRTVLNEARISLLGFTVAHVSELISRVP